MMHEAMILEYSGRHLAVIEAAASLKLLLYFSVIACVFVPWGIATAGQGFAAFAIGVVSYITKLAVGGFLLAVFETAMAKMRVFRVSGFPRGGADARPAGGAAAVRFAERVMDRLALDVAHLFAGGLVLVSFMLLYQDRMFGLLNIFALHAFVVSLSVAWQAHIQHAPHLYITAAIALIVKAIVIPVALHRIIVRLGIHRTIETVVGIGQTMLAGIGLVALVDHGHAADHGRGRNADARGPGVFIVGHPARPADDDVAAQRGEPGHRLHVDRERPDPRRDRRQGHAAGGGDQRRVFHPHRADRDRHFPVPHSRALRHGGRARAGTVPRGTAMNELGPMLVMAILAVPICSAALLALVRDDRTTARLNVLATLLTFLASTSLFFVRPDLDPYLIVDDVNVVFIVLSTFVGFTTSVFSASYIAHELETGRLTPTYLRFYHAMYQTLMFAMNLALLANNVGLMWVAVELATLTTVLMVGIYRTPAALEAAWKYFILGSVGIALALFGTILVYLAARSVVGEGLDAMAWNVLVKKAPGLRSGAAQPCVRVPAAGLRHQGRPRAAARLAARRACRRPDADLGGAVGAAAQRGAVRGAALQDDHVGQPRSAGARAADGDARAAFRCCSRRSCCTAATTSSACSPTRRSSTWGSSPSPSAWADRWRISPACCT